MKPFSFSNANAPIHTFGNPSPLAGKVHHQASGRVVPPAPLAVAAVAALAAQTVQAAAPAPAPAVESDKRPGRGGSKKVADELKLATKRTAKSIDLAMRIEQQTGCTLTEAKAKVAQVFAAMSAMLKEGEVVGISGFGTFYTRQKAEAKGWDFRRGVPVVVPERVVVQFKPSPKTRRIVESSPKATAN